MAAIVGEGTERILSSTFLELELTTEQIATKNQTRKLWTTALECRSCGISTLYIQWDQGKRSLFLVEFDRTKAITSQEQGQLVIPVWLD